jgi:ATP-dependent 26S proteasome regulatory subunit
MSKTVLENGFKEELSLLIRARYPLILVDTYEEAKLERLLKQFCVERKKSFFQWSFSTGLQQILNEGSEGQGCEDPIEFLQTLLKQQIPSGHQGGVYMVKDFHHHWTNPLVVRYLRDFVVHFQNKKINVVFCAPSSEIPSDLQKSVHILTMEFPSETQIRDLIDKIKQSVEGSPKATHLDLELTEEALDKLVKACQGLTQEEMHNALMKSLTKQKCFDFNTIIEEKSQIVKKTGILTYIDTSKIIEVGGLQNLKNWVTMRQKGFTEDAEQYGIPAPKGALLVGMQGCGKSLSAKKLAQWWGLPLYRLDMSKVMEGVVGGSERNMQLALEVAEGTAPAILWIDECEKALAGLSSSGASDSGTTARVIQSLLTWMEEHTSPVFVVMTANDVSQLPAELTREGRIDASFFIDLPNVKEREEILRIHIETKRRDTQTEVRSAEDFDVETIAMDTKGFTGSQLQQLIINSLWDSFNSGRDLDSLIVARNVKDIIPFEKAKKETVKKIRNWCEGKTIPASIPLEESEKEKLAIEIEG